MGYGNWEDGECCFDLVLVTDKAIKVQCVVWLSNNLSKSETAYSNITPAVLPKIQLRSEFKIDDNDMIAVFAGKESKLTCTVAGARPKPAVLWKIGERQITEGITTNSTTDKDSLVTIVETLHYTFAASDHGQTVRCITAGSWIDVEQDEYLASAMLNVWYSQPQDPITLYVLIVMVVIVPVTVYACKTGRRCFAGSPDCTVTGTWSRVEEENPGDIVKEIKSNGSHNPYKSWTTQIY